MDSFIVWFSRWYKGIIFGLAAFGVAMLVVLATQHVNGAVAAGATAGPIPTFSSAPTGPSPLDVPSGSKVLIVGDSYAAGTGASSERTRWTSILERDQHWDVTVDGVGGTGFTWGGGTDGTDGDTFAARIAEHASNENLNPALVILEGGQNDYRADAGDLSSAVADDVSAVKAAWPGAQVVVLGPAAPEPLATDIERMDSSVQAGALRAGAYSINPRTTKWFTAENSPKFNFDGAHVNDGGHELIASKIGDALDQFAKGGDATF